MARAKFQTLTEQMFYILLCLRQECCGMDIMERVREMTEGRVNVGPGTLYNLLDQFSQAEMIVETKVEGEGKAISLQRREKKHFGQSMRDMRSGGRLPPLYGGAGK